MNKFNKNSIIITLAISAVVGITGLVIAATSVSLLTADSFAVLAGSGITATTPSTVSGDVGTFPTTTETGTITVTGTNHAGDAVTQTAKTDLTAAYLNAEAQTLPSVTAIIDITTDSFSGTGYTLAPGIYKSANQIGVTGTLTLNGSATDVWIFQAGSTLTTASAAEIVLTGGAQACNVFWQVGSSATLGTNTLFKGSILALVDITDNGGSIIQGRLLARNGAVTLNNTSVVKPTCVDATILSIPRSTAPVAQAPAVVVPPLIDVVKVPSPLTLPLGGGSVTYTYTVRNIGTVPMHAITANDNKCSTVNYVSGDINSNSILEVNETWIYMCTKTVTQTETNTVTVRGLGPLLALDAYDVASATVVVGVPLVPPLIHVIKTPSVFVLPAVGGQVTYSYTVKNIGTVPVSDVSIVDDKCTGLPGRVVGHPGDINKNGLLDTTETFYFTCVTNLTQTTTNIATAEGHANGLTAIDFARATVVVAAPSLPNTGFGPEGKGAMWGLVVLAGVLAASYLGYAIRKRQTI